MTRTLFSGTVTYIEDIKLTDEATIRLFQVVDLYNSCLEQLGGDISQKMNATHLIKYRSLIWKLTKADNAYYKH